jgi:transcriptional regulator with XRE-family HTH domain
MTRSQIARSLEISTWRVTELLAGETPISPGLRARAKDDLRAQARELRAEGLTYDQIVQKLGVSKGSVSLWTRDLPHPPKREPGSYEFERVAAARRAQWEAVLAARDRERQANKKDAADFVGELSCRELLLVGAALYWAEGSKDKSYSRRKHLTFTNSDEHVIRVYLSWLSALHVKEERIGYRLSIHESADLISAHAYWSGVVGVPVAEFAKPNLKRHNPRTVRRNVGDQYHGCLVVRVLQSRAEYQRMAGLWHGIVEGSSGVV